MITRRGTIDWKMERENILQAEPHAREISDKGAKNRTNVWIAIHAVTFLAGLGLLVFVIYKIGYQSLFDSVSHIGWGFLAIVGLNLLRHLMRSATMYLAVSPEVRTFKYRSAVAARLGGEAVNFFTFTGPFLGDATKAVLLKKDVSLTHSASAVLIDNLLYYVSVILVVLTGVAILLVNFGSGGSSMLKALAAIVIVSVLLFIGFMLAIVFSVTPFSRGMSLLDERGWLPKFLSKKREHIQNVETNVFRFYHERTADFFIVFFISMTVHAVSVAEVYLALKFLGYDATVATAFIIESLTKVINAVFSFIPGTIGVYEGGNGIILKTLGYTTGVGVALALVRRGAILISTVLGIIILLWRTAASGARRLASEKEG